MLYLYLLTTKCCEREKKSMGNYIPQNINILQNNNTAALEHADITVSCIYYFIQEKKKRKERAVITSCACQHIITQNLEKRRKKKRF